MNTNPLIQAIKSNNLEEVLALLQNGSNLPSDFNGYSFYQIIKQLIQAESFEILLALIKNKCIEMDLYEYENLDNTLFECLMNFPISSEKNRAVFKEIVNYIEQIDAEVDHKTIVQLGFELKADWAIIAELFNAGFPLDYKNTAEDSLIHQIIETTKIDPEKGVVYIENLLGMGIDVDQPNIIKNTALMQAINRNETAYIDLLLEHNANCNIQNKEGKSSFYQVIVEQQNLELYQKLCAYEAADFNQVDKQQETLILAYLRMSDKLADTNLLACLIADGADLNQVAPYYDTEKSGIEWLVEKNANALQLALDLDAIDINNQDNRGNTLLHLVCAYDSNYEQEKAKENYRKVKLLIEKGANVLQTNDKDETPLQLALNDPLKTKTVELLIKAAKN